MSKQLPYDQASRQTGVVLIEFYASWCPHCQRMMPVVEQVKELLNGQVPVYQYDIDQHQDWAAEAQVESIPTFIICDNAEEVWRQSGIHLQLVEQVWPEIIRLAEDCKTKIAIENCPMLFGPEQWPGGQNLMCTPAIWKAVFDRLPSDYLGLNYDPSHFVWQMMDYIAPLYTFRDKIFHVHFKDIKILRDRLNQVGILAYPLDYMSPKIPGLGDVNWGQYVSALTDIGYDGFACIEVEDRAFEDSRQKILDSLVLSKRYMEQFVI